MKKITSIIFALTFVLYVMASPVHLPNQAKSGKQQLEQRLAKAKTDKEKLEIIYKYKMAQSKQHKKLVAKNAGLRMPQAAMESAYSIERFSTFFSAEEGKIFYGLHSESGKSFFFDIVLPQGKHDVELGKTYTLADMDSIGSEWDDEEGGLHFYKTATFKKTKGAGFDFHIEAVITDVDDNEFTLSYDETPLTLTGDTVAINIERPLSGCTYISSDMTWLVRADNNSAHVDLRFYSSNSESPAGTFQSDDIELSSTYLNLLTGEYDEYDDPVIKEVYAKDAEIKVEDNDGRLDIKFTIVGDDGNVYVGTLFYATPKAEKQEDFVSNDLMIDEWGLYWGELIIFANSEDGKYLSINLYVDDSATDFTGEYEFDENSYNNASITVDGEQYDIFSGSIKLEQSGDKYVITGKLLAWNNVEYNLNLKTPDPTITPATFSGDKLVLDTYPPYGYYEVSGYDSEHENYLLLTINSANVAGDFGIEDIDLEYTYAVFNNEEYEALSADLNVSYTDGVATVTGTILLVNSSNQYDQILLTLDIKAGPYVPSERNVNISMIAFEPAGDATIYYGLLSEDAQQEFYFNILVEPWVADVKFGQTYTLADMIEDYSYGVNYDEREYVIYESVTFTKTSTDAGVSIVVTIVDTRGNKWNLTYAGVDQEPQQIYVELGQANQVGWADQGLQYEMIDVDNSFACYLVFPIEDGATIPDDIVYDSLYTSADGSISLEYSYLSIRKEEHKITEATFSKSVDGEAQYVEAIVTDDRGFTYVLSYYDDGFQLTGDTIKITINQPVEATDWGYGEWVLHAEDAEQVVHLVIYAENEDAPLGTYTDEVSLWNSRLEFIQDPEESSWWLIGIHNVDYVTISQAADGYAMEAVVVGDDGNVYVIEVNQMQSSIINPTDMPAATKRIENGVLIIERNGLRYNVNGAVIR